MNEELTQEIINRLDKMGELGGQGFEVLIRQAYYSAFFSILGSLIAFSLVWAAYKVIRNFGYLGGERIWGTNPYDDPAFPAGLAATGGILAGIFGYIILSQGILQILNPEYYAIRAILRAVGG